MDLALNNALFIVCGASSGFGEALARKLVAEGATVIGISRREAPLQVMTSELGKRFEFVVADLTELEHHARVWEKVGDRTLTGAVINAGGPPATQAIETDLATWDQGYQQVMRWKIAFMQGLLPRLQAAKYGRILLIESVSVKQPMPNLVLSNAFRSAVVSYIKTLSREVAGDGITMNILAPGWHETSAINRIIDKRIELSGQSRAEILTGIEATIPTGNMGNPADMAELGVWLLSEGSRYMTGQTITVDGGSVQGLFG
ncbi:MAG: SDR family oxidoreductase [Bacteroidota bacterium]